MDASTALPQLLPLLLLVAAVCAQSLSPGGDADRSQLPQGTANGSLPAPAGVAGGPVAPGARTLGGEGPAAPAGRSLGQCKVTSDCQANAECTNGRCECYSNYTLISTTNTCVLAARQVGDYCEYDPVCQHNLGGRSKCENTRCVCQTDSVGVLNGTSCFLKRELGESCSHHEQCRHKEHASCTDICGCDPEFVSYNNNCTRVINKYNEVCEDTVLCSNGKLGFGATCKKEENSDTKRCVCAAEFFYKQSNEVCMYAKGLDEECDEKNLGCYLHEDGTSQNVECNKKNRCQCKKGYYPSESKTRCSKDAGVMNNASYLLMILALACVTRW